MFMASFRKKMARRPTQQLKTSKVVATEIFLEFSPRTLGKRSNLTCAYFSDGWVGQPPTRKLQSHKRKQTEMMPPTKL